MNLEAHNGPDPSHLVQAIMKRRPTKEEWLAYDAIMRLHRNATPAKRREMAPLIEQANRRMGALENAERRRMTMKGAS